MPFSSLTIAGKSRTSVYQACLDAEDYFNRIYSTGAWSTVGGTGAPSNTTYENYIYEWAQEIGKYKEVYDQLRANSNVYLVWPDDTVYIAGSIPPCAVPFFPTLGDRMDPYTGLPQESTGDCLRNLNGATYHPDYGLKGDGVSSSWYIPVYQSYMRGSANLAFLYIRITGNDVDASMRWGQITNTSSRCLVSASNASTNLTLQIATSSNNLSSFFTGWPISIMHTSMQYTADNNVSGPPNYRTYFYTYDTPIFIGTYPSGTASFGGTRPFGINGAGNASTATYSTSYSDNATINPFSGQGVGALILASNMYGENLKVVGEATDQLNSRFGRL